MKRHLLYLAYVAFVAVISIVLIYTEHNSQIPSQKTVYQDETMQATEYRSDLSGVSFPIDLNRATYSELLQIDGIYEALAQRIIDYRVENGEYDNLEQLLNVYGIGEATFAKISPFLYVENAQTETSAFSVFTEANDEYVRVNLNTGTLEDFKKIPIITDKQAQAIIDLRDKISYFSHYYELLYAEGFNEELVAAMNEYVYVE